MYKRIQAAGKIVHLELPWPHVEPLVRELDPSLLMLQTHVASCADGERLLAQAAAWARSAKLAQGASAAKSRPAKGEPCHG